VKTEEAQAVTPPLQGRKRAIDIIRLAYGHISQSIQTQPVCVMIYA